MTLSIPTSGRRLWMVSKTKSVRPHGARSCSHQLIGAAPHPKNSWDSSSEYNEIAYGKALQDVQGKVPPLVLAKAAGDFFELLKKVEDGKASLGRGDRFDVDSMDSVVDVLELKWKSLPPRTDDSPYVGLRLYYAEPKRSPGKLLKLKLVCKIPVRAAQDQDAKEAQERFDNWLKGEKK